MSLSPGSRVGGYDVISIIGRGGMGEVYRGRDSRLERDVALKVLPDAKYQTPSRVSRFEREARALASLNHPNIASIFGLEAGPSQPGAAETTVIVMEMVEGETLADRLELEGRYRSTRLSTSPDRWPPLSRLHTRRASSTAISSPPT